MAYIGVGASCASFAKTNRDSNLYNLLLIECCDGNYREYVMTPNQTANISIGIVLVTMVLLTYVALGLPWVTSFVAG